jgi:hypothetical protein
LCLRQLIGICHRELCQKLWMICNLFQ